MQYYGTSTALSAESSSTDTLRNLVILELLAFILIPPLLVKMWRNRRTGRP